MIRKRIIHHKLRSAGIGPDDFLYPYGAHHIPVNKGDELLLIKAILSEAIKIMKKKTSASDVGKIFEQTAPVKVKDIVKKLQLDAKAKSALDGIIRDYVDSANPLIIIGESVTGPKDLSGLKALVDLALLKGLYDNDRLRLVVLKPNGNSMGAYQLLNRFDREKQAQTIPKGGLVLLEQDPPQDSPYLKIPGDLDFLAVISPYWPDSLAGPCPCAHSQTLMDGNGRHLYRSGWLRNRFSAKNARCPARNKHILANPGRSGRKSECSPGLRFMGCIAAKS